MRIFFSQVGVDYIKGVKSFTSFRGCLLITADVFFNKLYKLHIHQFKGLYVYPFCNGDWKIVFFVCKKKKEKRWGKIPVTNESERHAYRCCSNLNIRMLTFGPASSTRNIFNRRYRIWAFRNALWYWKGDKTKENPTGKMIMS